MQPTLPQAKQQAHRALGVGKVPFPDKGSVLPCHADLVGEGRALPPAGDLENGDKGSA